MGVVVSGVSSTPLSVTFMAYSGPSFLAYLIAGLNVVPCKPVLNIQVMLIKV
jgi:hypothetical protein